MALPAVDWFMTIFFFAALILMARFRRQLVAVDPKSYREISVGLGLLALAALARLYTTLGILHRVPFLSEPIFFQLILWVIIITGITLLIGGVAEWLPLARRSRELNQQTIARASLFRELEQLGSIEPRPEPFFQTVLAHVVEAHKFRCGAMYSVTARGDRLRFLGAVNCTAHELRLADVSIEQESGTATDGEMIAGLGVLAGLPAELGRPVYQMPVEVRGRVRGIFLFWSDTIPDKAAVLDLKLVGEIVARRILHRSQQIKVEFFESVEKLYHRLNRQLTESAGPAERLTGLVRELRSLMSIDFALLQIAGENERLVDRLSLGANARVLIERNVEPGPALSLLQLFVQTTDAGVNAIDSPLRENLCRELPGNLHSLVVVNTSIGQLVLGSDRPNAYTPAILKALDYIAPHVRTLLDGYRTQRSLALLDHQLGELTRLTQTPSDDLRTVISDLVSYLRELLAVDAIRVSVLDKSGVFLNSLGLASSASSPAMAPELGSMVLGLLPLHAQALETGQPVVWSRQTPAAPLSESEARAISAGTIGCLLLAPFGSAGAGLRGLFTIVAEDDCLARLTSDPGRFVLRAAGSLLAGLLLRVQQPLRLVRRPETTVPARGEAMHRSEIRSSLTGILASVELMRSLHEPDREAVTKFLNIIDRSARKIDAFVETPAVMSTAPTGTSYATR